MRRSDFLKTAGFGLLGAPIMGYQNNAEKPLIKPKRLKEGDTVGLAAPAGMVHDTGDFDRMQAALESFGLHVQFGEFARNRHGYFAGEDEQRALDLMRFFLDPDIDGIIAVRGGWGSARIVPHLNFESIKANPKVFCGFSDNTTLHLALLHYCSLISFHGPNGASDWTPLTRKSFRQVLMEGKAAGYVSKSEVATIMPGIAEGRLIGGNLSILTTAAGTPYQPDTTGAILFVEDISEPPYKIDRMLTHLKAAGMMENLTGFIFGGCTDCRPPRVHDFSNREIIEQHIIPLGIPAVMGMDISHDPDNFTVPLGITATLDANKGTLALKEAAVI